MNELSEQLIGQYKPVLAIVVYHRDGNEYYLESHPIGDNGKLQEGRPLEAETIQGIVDVFYEESKTRAKVGGIIPYNLLTFCHTTGSYYKMVWYTPPGGRNLLFDENRLCIPSGWAHVPGMIYAVDNNRLSVYAYQEQGRPEEKTVLMQAPFYNTGDGGTVCLGSAKAAKTSNTYKGLMQYWEDLFWNSIFTYLTGSNPTKTNLTMIWKRLLEDITITWDDIDELKPTKTKPKTLNDLL